MSKSYISYFQSVITLGILSEGDGKEDALAQAEETMKDPNGVNHCFFDQTQFEPVATETWEPELESKNNHNGLQFDFNPSEKTRAVIATRLQKTPSELTNADIEIFVKESIQYSLEKA